MSEKMALKLAIDLLHVPSHVRLVRAEPLPDSVPILLRIAAGDEEAERAAVALSGRSLATIRRAAVFFIEQIMFAPGADSYRVLGANSAASQEELRRNVGLLLKWLHPDLDSTGERSIFVGRVTAAWNDLKTPDRRAAYDAMRGAQKTKSRSRTGKSRMGRQIPVKSFGDGRYPRVPPRGIRSWSRGADSVGFFRRALAVLFNRPLQ